MRPLTNTVPKPLLKAGGASLIEHTVRALADAGFTDLVINHAYLGTAIEVALGDGSRYGVNIRYSPEPEGALETGGGIYRALPMLGDYFLVVNGDIWTNYPFVRLHKPPSGLAHLVLIDNPSHNMKGDFALNGDLVENDGALTLTFTGIGVYRSTLFEGSSPGRFPLAPLLRKAIDQKMVTGERYTGRWDDIGTPERLLALDHFLAESRHKST